MADERKTGRFWGDFLECVLEYVPYDVGLGILGCIAAAFVLAGIIWAANRLWESFFA